LGKKPRKAAGGAAKAGAGEALAQSVAAGDRRALAKAITLVESTRPDHRLAAEDLARALTPPAKASIRIGITGVPGVGKSTFIEALGLFLIGRGHRVAVLAVDPTSRRSGGSILGDKTRMRRLARHREAFIRPSPSGGAVGGVARRTRDIIPLVEAAGFDVVIVETVGVGQSETAVAEMVDMFALLISPAGGDDLQGMKRGIVELADLIVVNKDDGVLRAAAEQARHDYAAAVGLIRPATAHWKPEVLTCSSTEIKGIDRVWDAVERYRRALNGPDGIAARRRAQAQNWMWAEVDGGLAEFLRADPGVKRRLKGLQSDVAAGKLPPGAAARTILEIFLKHA